MSPDLETVRALAADVAADLWGRSEVDVQVEPKTDHLGDDYLEVRLGLSLTARRAPTWGEKAERYVVDVWRELTRVGEHRFPLVRFLERKPLAA